MPTTNHGRRWGLPTCISCMQLPVSIQADYEVASSLVGNIVMHLTKSKTHRLARVDGKFLKEALADIKAAARRERENAKLALQRRVQSAAEASDATARRNYRPIAPANTHSTPPRATTPLRSRTGFTPLPQTPPHRGSKSPSTTPGGTRKH